MTSYIKTGRPEDLHHFRVQVKKLRAVLILSDDAGRHQKLAAHFKPIKKIFKQAGTIRNAYMNLELGRLHQINDDDFIGGQQELMQKTNEKFTAEAGKHLEEMKEAYRKICAKIKPVADLHIQLFYQHQLQQIFATVKRLRFDERLHDCRKQIKILIYNHKMAHHVPGLALNEAYLDRVQSAIGDWHDNFLTSQLFAEKGLGKPALSNLHKQQKKIKRQIGSLVKDFYNRATTNVQLPLEQLS
ncbi:MAG TPA: CHAD domain-containing protein [Mucilaginibacter sp.]